jgi:hypothetical protein
VLIAANLVASVLRFLLYRHWVFGVFGRHRGSGQRQDPGWPAQATAAAWPGRDPAIGKVELATHGERNP